VNTLRNRLLASYVAILLIMLVLIGFVLIVFLATRPLPVDNIINRLSATLLDVRLRESLRIEVDAGGMMDQGQNAQPDAPQGFQIIPNEPGSGQMLFVRPEALLSEIVIPFLDEQAAKRDVRALVVTNDRQVIYDSGGEFSAGDLITELERKPLAANRRLAMNNTLFQGRFEDPDGHEWVYVAQPVRPLLEVRPESVFVMVAEPVPTASLRQVFNIFGDTFLVPLVQAGLIGLVLATGLALLISGSVARPLGRMSRAARHIAEGNYRQRVRVNGPREVRALAVSFNDMAARVASSQQAQRDFMANVSHDLRTPLTSIQGFSQAIVDGVAADPASAQHAAQIIYDEAARLHRMVESLLDMARIEAGQVDMTAHAVALGDLLHAIGERMALKAQEKHLALVMDIPPDLPRIAGDGDRLAQVFTNLLDNAIKHTHAGQITLCAEADERGIAVTVRDTGEGIPAADLPRIFERFYRVDKSRQPNQRRSGMGLGLAITRQIVEAHGGAIQVASEVGQGTTFTVWLPLPRHDMTAVVVRP
jgi:two-component system OmpR family sensor kinase